MSLVQPPEDWGFVRPERTGWRDQGLSERHRQWGFHVPMLDIDFLVAEYDRCRATALVEYKREDGQSLSLAHVSLLVLQDLGDRARLPVFAVRYAIDYSWFTVTAINDLAKKEINGDERQHLSERQYVEFLYRLRRYSIPRDVLARIETVT